MRVPSVKGVLFAGDVEDVQKLLAAGSISRAALEQRLDAAAVASLEQPVAAAGWYDIRIAKQLVELLCDVEGEGSKKFLIDRGARNAERMFKAGLYQQLDYLERSQTREAPDAATRARAYGRDLKLLTTLSATCFNFAEWNVRPDPKHESRFIIDVTDASDLPDVHCWCTLGYMNWMAVRHRGGDVWRWRRETADHVVFEMTRDP